MRKSANAGGKEIAGRFKPGQSGNPAGKKPGTRHRVTELAEKLMSEDAEAVVRSVITAAKGGDMQAARLVIERILPPRRSRSVQIALPKVDTPQDLLTAMSTVVEAVASGEIDPHEGEAVASLLEAKRRTLEVVDFDKRLTALENKEPKK